MIESVTVTNYVGDSLTMGIGDPDQSGLLITNIEGIGPGQAVINTTEVATFDGSMYNSSRMYEKNIVLTIRLGVTGGVDVETARHMSYKYFPIKKLVSLTFVTDNKVSTIDGYVESNVPKIFTDGEECQISIICPNPYFKSEYVNFEEFASVIPTFEFPFSNESLDERELEISVIQLIFEKNIVYPGEADVGMIIQLHAIGTVRNVTLHNIVTGEKMTLNTDRIAETVGKGFIKGDTITICTIKGEKSITLTREGETKSILNVLDKDADWFQLTRGNNIFQYEVEEGIEALQVSIFNQILYEGV